MKFPLTGLLFIANLKLKVPRHSQDFKAKTSIAADYFDIGCSEMFVKVFRSTAAPGERIRAPAAPVALPISVSPRQQHHPERHAARGARQSRLARVRRKRCHDMRQRSGLAGPVYKIRKTSEGMRIMKNAAPSRRIPYEG